MINKWLDKIFLQIERCKEELKLVKKLTLNDKIISFYYKFLQKFYDL